MHYTQFTDLIPSPSPSPCVSVYIYIRVRYVCCVYKHMCVSVCVSQCACVHANLFLAFTVGRLSGMRLCCRCPSMCAVFSQNTTSSRALYLPISCSLSTPPPAPRRFSFSDSLVLMNFPSLGS